MRFALPLLATLAIFAATPAFACSCSPDADGSLAAKVLADPSISVAQVYVRGMNVNNHQSMLDIKAVPHGGLMAQNIRAKFGADSCATIPQYKKTMMVLIRAEEDATYSIVGSCETAAVMQSTKKGQ